jgi:hypothetical protein
MALNALEAANAASRRARQERMAAVGALPLTGLQLPGALEMIEPSERLEADCWDQVQTLAQEILRRGGRNGRRSGIGGTRGSEAGRGGGRQGKSRSNAARHYAPASDAHPYKWGPLC